MTLEDDELSEPPLDTAEMKRLKEKLENDKKLTASERARLRQHTIRVADAAEDINAAIAEAFEPMVEQLGTALEEIGSAFADALDDADWEDIMRPLHERPDDSIEYTFKRRKEKGMNMVHRLRDWEAGDTIWGYDIQIDNGNTTGKTFSRNDSTLVPEDEPYVEQVEERMEQMLDTHPSPAVGVVWVGTVETVTTEAHDHSDPGEPPLKHASVTDVCVKTVSRRPE